MFFNAVALFTLSLPIFASAVAVSLEQRGGGNVCTGGTLQCCNQTQDSKNLDGSATKILALLGINVGDISNLVGISCNPITVIGISGTSCNQQSVCCENDNFNGVVAIGCTPVNANL
ncbi:hypothetical protein AX17_006666 [Amanita inopinata Kibby_2008]|nr:hypothetical protein AX17_006666 [Amanita inopinata Kibby_2008]